MTMLSIAVLKCTLYFVLDWCKSSSSSSMDFVKPKCYLLCACTVLMSFNRKNFSEYLWKKKKKLCWLGYLSFIKWQNVRRHKRRKRRYALCAVRRMLLTISRVVSGSDSFVKTILILLLVMHLRSGRPAEVDDDGILAVIECDRLERSGNSWNQPVNGQIRAITSIWNG